MSSRIMMMSDQWRVAGCSQRESFPAAEAVVASRQKVILPAVVAEQVVVRQRVRHPELVELWCSRTKTRLDRAAAGSWYFQTIRQLTAQAAECFQMVPHPEAAESEYSRTESRPPRAAAAAAAVADQIEARPSAFLSSASYRRETLSAAVAGCCQTRRSLLASLRIRHCR